ncbi:MAG: DUF6476 family protein [Pseudomonadota bacterium]
MADPDNFVEPPNLRFLRRLVTVLTAVMICGLLVIIGLFVTRLSAPTPVAPETLELPEGVTARAFTTGPDWYAVVTTDDQILIFNRSTGTLRQTVDIE